MKQPRAGISVATVGGVLVTLGSWVMSRTTYIRCDCDATAVRFAPVYLPYLITGAALVSLVFFARPRLWWIGDVCVLLGAALPAAVWMVGFRMPQLILSDLNPLLPLVLCGTGFVAIGLWMARPTGSKATPNRTSPTLAG